jgi:hypothetical protein
MPIVAYYAGDGTTYHPQLGQIEPGANEFPDELQDVVEACVEAGLLSLDPATPREAHDADAGEAGGQEPEANA